MFTGRYRIPCCEAVCCLTEAVQFSSIAFPANGYACCCCLSQQIYRNAGALRTTLQWWILWSRRRLMAATATLSCSAASVLTHMSKSRKIRIKSAGSGVRCISNLYIHAQCMSPDKLVSLHTMLVTVLTCSPKVCCLAVSAPWLLPISD